MDFSDEGLATNYKDLVKSVRRDANDIYSRLRSIDEDAAFVRRVKEANPTLPLVANLRCGSWYVDPSLAHPDTPAYFKSTDGHESQWEFSLRRSNLHLLSVISKHGGIILVDSTRRGKRLPDALSKTIPAWCATINRALALRDGHGRSKTTSEHDASNESEVEDGWEKKIWVPSRSVGDSERAQMESRLDGWAEKLLNSSLTLLSLSLPLRPIFLYNPSPSDPSTIPSLPPPSVLGFHPVICLSASQYLAPSEERRRPGGWEYHQGAGDDHELWGKGLGPAEWWEWREELLSVGRDALEEEVGRRVGERRNGRNGNGEAGGMKGGERNGSEEEEKPATLILPTELVYLSTLPQPTSPSRPTISIHFYPFAPPPSTSPLHLVLVQRSNKDGISPLLAQIVEFLEPHVRAGRQVVIACEDGKDASVGAAVCMLHLLFDEEGKLRGEGDPGTASKSSIHTRLHWILNARPGANPSRSTLKRVNTFLMSSRFAP